MINQSLLSIRTISNIYNFKLYRIVYKLKAKYTPNCNKVVIEKSKKPNRN